ncbi:MAG TPA: CRISPR-associated protein Cas4 [Oscillospiraceae bacterium]|nr:CRISPR-associated protein Cas4 [Oscillospiraceae bacterium]
MHNEIAVTGTDIWYYFVCRRRTWLSIRKIFPDEEDENMEIGRFIHEYRYGRNKKEIGTGPIKLDSIKRADGSWVVMEVKKSSKYFHGSYYQLLYYLYILEQKGIIARGELLFPEERKREVVELTEESRVKLKETIRGIEKLAQEPVSPYLKKISACKNCAYNEYCWSEV